MKNENGKIYFGIGLDNDQLRADALQSRNIIKGIGDSTVAESSRIDNAFRKIAGSVAAVFTAQQAFAFAKQIAVVRGEFQQLEVAMTTLLQSKSKATALMTEMVDLAAKTPFKLTDVAGGAKQLIAYGFEAESITGTLTRLGNIASGLGLPMERLTYLYGTTMTQGRLYARDLMQFTTSGIPMLQGLADMFGVTTNEVNHMVEAGKVGFPEVQKVIENLTNEGGKFYNLMEEQSKTIGGKISNLGDAIDVMYNKIGQSQEGVINDVLDGAKYMVEHYEAVGSIITTLIATYGTYKAAVIVLSAVERARLAATLSGEVAVCIATRQVTAMQALRYIATMKLKNAQELLNITMAKNPYMLIGMAVAALAVGTYNLVKAITKETEAEKALREEQERKLERNNNYLASISKEQAEVDVLFGRLKALTSGTKEYNNAKDEIISKYGQYLKGLSNEVQSLKDVEGAYKAISTAAVQAARDRAISEVISASAGEYAKVEAENLRGIRTLLTETKGVLDGEKIFTSLKESLRTGTEFSDEVKNAIGYTAQWGRETTVVYDKVVPRMKGIFESLIYSIKDSKSEMNSEVKEIEDILGGVFSASGEGYSTLPIITVTEKIKYASEALALAKKELKDAIKIDADYSVVKTKTENVDSAQKDYDDALKLARIDPKAAKTAAEDAAKLQKAIADAQLKATNDFYDAEIALKRKQITDKVKLIEFDRDNTIAAIEAEKQAYLQLAVASGAKTSDIDTSMYENRKQMITLSAKIDIDNVGVEEMDKVKTQLEALKQEFETFEQERTRIQAEYAAKRKAMYEEDGKTLKQEFTQGNVEELDRQTNKALADMDASIRGSTGLWSSLFENFAYKSKKDLTEIADNARNVLEYVNNTPVNKIEGKFGMSSEQLKALKNDVSGFADAYEKLNEIESAANSKNPFSALIGGAKSYKNSLERVETAKKALESVKANSNSTASDIKEAEQAVEDAEQASEKIKINLKESVAEVGQKMTQIGDAFKQAGESLENNILSDIGQSLSLIGNTASKITSGDYLGAVLGLFTAWAEAEGRHKKALKEVQQSIIEYQKEYNALLHDAAMESSDSIFGDKKLLDAKKYYAEAQKQQDILNLKMNDLASGKVVTGHKKTGLFGWGKGKDLYSDILSVYPELIDENGKFNAGVAETILSTQKLDDTTTQTLNNLVQYSNQAEAAMNALNDISNEIVGGMASTMTDAIFNAIEEGASGWDAFHDSGADAIKALGKMMVKELIITNYLDKYSDDIAEMLGKGDKEGIMDIFKQIATEMPSIYELAADATQQIYDAADKAGYDMIGEADREASKRGIATASQDSVDENNGRLTSIQGHIYSINESIKIIQPDIASIKDIMSIMKGNSAEQLKVLQGIESNTAPISEIKTELKYVKSALETIRDKGITIKK